MTARVPDIHMPWDRGAIDAALKDIFGVGRINKTIKTTCGARVPLARAAVVNITCPLCCAELRAQLNQFEEIAKAHPRPDFVKAAAAEREFFKNACGLL